MDSSTTLSSWSEGGLMAIMPLGGSTSLLNQGSREVHVILKADLPALKVNLEKGQRAPAMFYRLVQH